MPRIYRTMEMIDGRPAVGESRIRLGVRVPPNRHPDIVPDEGNVKPGQGGMSVMPDAKPRIPSLVPMRLRAVHPRYAGGTVPGNVYIFCTGLGEFVDGVLTERLKVRVNSETHGCVEPSAEMTLDNYCEALADTRDQW